MTARDALDCLDDAIFCPSHPDACAGCEIGPIKNFEAVCERIVMLLLQGGDFRLKPTLQAALRSVADALDAAQVHTGRSQPGERKGK